MNIIASNRPFRNKVASNPKELGEYLSTHKDIRRIYFPFWSWKVENEILDKYECIGFHSAPLPKGRGGSPIQNMIRCGFDVTEVCAFKMTPDMDSGTVLLRSAVELDGTLERIIEKITDIIETMIYKIENNNFDDVNKLNIFDFSSVPEKFERITDNFLPESDELKNVYNEIRMRDEPNHPKTFIYHGKFKLVFTQAELTKGKVTAVVEFYENEF